MKKILSSIIAITIIFSPIGNVIFQDVQQTEVSAKKYRSGTKSFNKSNTGTKVNNQQNTKNQNTVNSSTAGKNNTGKSGGFMKGMLYGGLAGLMFGGLISSMGALGPIFGMMVNILAILVVFLLISKVIKAIRNNRYKEENGQWRR